MVEPPSTVPYLISVCLARSSADSMGDCILSTVRKAARLAVYDEIMMSVKNHHTLPTIRPDIDLRRDRDFTLPALKEKTNSSDLHGRASFQVPPPRVNKAAHSGFESQRRCHQKSKTGVSVASQKGLMSSNFFFKKSLLFHSPQSTHIVTCEEHRMF